MLSRRKLKRRHLIYYLRVFDIKTNELLGHLVDISPGGVKIMSEGAIPIGDKYQLKMHLPDEMENATDIIFDVECVWSEQDINPEFFAAGFQIQQIDSEHARVIDRLIEEFGFRD